MDEGPGQGIWKYLLYMLRCLELELVRVSETPSFGALTLKNNNK